MAETEAPIALVTGANKGIGLEVARGLVEAGAVVYVGARNPELGESAAADLRAEGHDARFVQLEVTSPQDIEAAAARIDRECGRLDILVNNAAGGLQSPSPSQTDLAALRRTFETNTFAPFAIIQAMLPLLRRSAAGRIVNVSSDFGSLTLNSDPTMPHSQAASLAYPSSKAALNQMTIQLAKEFRGTPIKINSANPGFTDTDMTAGAGFKAGRGPEVGAKPIIAMALIGEDGPSGGFFDENGVLPW